MTTTTIDQLIQETVPVILAKNKNGLPREVIENRLIGALLSHLGPRKVDSIVRRFYALLKQGNPVFKRSVKNPNIIVMKKVKTLDGFFGFVDQEPKSSKKTITTATTVTITIVETVEV